MKFGTYLQLGTTQADPQTDPSIIKFVFMYVTALNSVTAEWISMKFGMNHKRLFGNHPGNTKENRSRTLVRLFYKRKMS